MAAITLPLGLVLWGAVNFPPAWLHPIPNTAGKADVFAAIIEVLGILSAVSGLRQSNKKLCISVNTEGLTLLEARGKSTKSRTWKRSKIAAISVTLFQRNHYVLSTALQLEETNGTKALLITGRLEHLRHTATVLRRELGCAPRPIPAVSPQQPETENPS
jgi:hypothetical protein